VTHIDPENNTVTLGDESDLDASEMTVAKLNWIKYEQDPDGAEVTTKIRYKDPGALSVLSAGNGSIDVRFFQAVKGIAPGQSAVFYEGADVVGGGIIQRMDNP
jgi:tRNA-specific 2-thiouridylase